MRANFPVVLDACVIATYSVFDLLMRLAEDSSLLSPRWTAEIWDEARRAYDKIGWEPDMVSMLVSEVQTAFPEAMVVDYESLLPSCGVEEKDRHVLAAAIRSRTETIVTFNVRHFPSDALRPWDVIAVNPDQYLSNMYDIDSGAVVARLSDIADRRGLSREETLVRLGRHVPRFAQHVARELGWAVPPDE